MKAKSYEYLHINHVFFSAYFLFWLTFWQWYLFGCVPIFLFPIHINFLCLYQRTLYSSTIRKRAIFQNKISAIWIVTVGLCVLATQRIRLGVMWLFYSLVSLYSQHPQHQYVRLTDTSQSMIVSISSIPIASISQTKLPCNDCTSISPSQTFFTKLNTLRWRSLAFFFSHSTYLDTNLIY